MKLRDGIFLLPTLILSFCIVYFGSSMLFPARTDNALQKPVIRSEEKSAHSIVDENTAIVFEQEYRICGHKIISEFKQREQINGKNLDEIRKIYSEKNGFRIFFDEDTLIIKQIIYGICPEEEESYRLKDYQGFVGIYMGLDRENDHLLRVTLIQIKSLPPSIQQAIREGKYEFKSEEELYDSLENLDEFLPNDN